jgi:predicted acylesterase/phospholipase RssA
MKALVLSGGAAKGAFIGGMLEYMKLKEGKEYDMYLSTSTGTLIQMLASINDFTSLREGYTSMDIKGMYDVSPFKKVKDPKDAGRADINLWSAVRMILFRKEPTFGDNQKFKETIKSFFPYEKYLLAYDSGINMTSTVTNMSKNKTMYFDMKSLGRNEKGYEDFVEWTWTSTCAVPFTSISRKVVGESGNIIHHGEHPVVYSDYFADGGFKEHMPISQAIKDGATEIDAISSNTEEFAGDMEPEFGANPLKLLARMFEITMREAMDRDIDNARSMAKDKDVTLRVYYAPRQLTENGMYFDKEQMSGWWTEGYEYMEHNHEHDEKCCKVFKMKARKAKKKK